MIMRRKLLPLFVLVSGLSVMASPVNPASPPQPLPTPFPEARYQRMSSKSPFAVASATANANAAPTPGFAAQLYVDGLAHVGKKDFVAIKSRDPDQQSVIFLAVGDSTSDGMKVERVQWSEQMGKSTVDVSKNGEKATLIFDEQQMAKNGASAPAVPGQVGVRLPTIPGRPSTGFPPQSPRIFPQPGQPFMGPTLTPQQGGPGMPGGMPMRRRVRVIQSGQ
jgi:hypothetical protein